MINFKTAHKFIVKMKLDELYENRNHDEYENLKASVSDRFRIAFFIDAHGHIAHELTTIQHRAS